MTETNTNQKEAAEKIEQVLKDHNLALQPFLRFSENGIIPGVRFADLEQEGVTKDKTDDNARQGDNSEKTGASEDEDGAAKPVSS